MNREIKFRAWDSINKEMRYPRKKDVFATGVTSGEMVDNWDEIMQFTGLKDKNGVEICEGDIVQYRVAEQSKESESYQRKEIVQFYCGSFKIGPACLSEWTHQDGLVGGGLKNRYYISHGRVEMYMIDFDIEVIGNIHQNPELLNL